MVGLSSCIGTCRLDVIGFEVRKIAQDFFMRRAFGQHPEDVCHTNSQASDARYSNVQSRQIARSEVFSKAVDEFLQIVEIKWRRCMGIEPTEPGFRRTPLDLKSRPATRPDSPPQRPHCSSPLRQLDRPEFSIRLTSLEYFLELGA